MSALLSVKRWNKTGTCSSYSNWLRHTWLRLLPTERQVRKGAKSAGRLWIDNVNALFRFWQRRNARVSLALGVTCLALGASAQTTFNVGNSGTSSYVVNGANNPTLTLQRGVTYTFNINSTGHPFYIKTVADDTGTGNQYTTGVTGNGASPGTVTFAVPASAPNTLYYQCSLHIAMGGTLNIVNASSNTAPSVAVTNPPNGAVFFAPANVTIQATASDIDGTVTNVQFRVGSVVLANDASAPYAAVTNGLVAGNFTLFAIAADNGGALATNSVNIVVNASNTPPSVTITNPANGAVFFAPANVTIQATASDTGGAVTNVQFRVGSVVLANDASAPYAAVTNGLVAGNFTLSAIASDNGGALATNSVNVVVDAPPSVTITNPPNGAFFVAPANLTIQAGTSDSDGTVTNVQFLIGSFVLANDTTPPYAAVSNGVPAGSFVLTAIAADNYGARATNTVNILVNAPPSVTVTNPPNGATFAAPANITIQATAVDSDGTITNVQFLVGSAVVANDTVAPYAAATNGLPEGNYTLAAVASDNRGTRATNSVNISVNANAPPVIRIVFVSVSNFITIKSIGTNGWSAVPEYQCTLTPSNWTAVPNFTNSFVNNTNTTTFDRLEAICGSSNVFLRIRNTKN